MADLDFGNKLYVGNYDFWKESSELAGKITEADRNAKAEEKLNNYKEFVARLSANASKSKQATAVKCLTRLNLREIVPSSRKYPFINLKAAERGIGNDLLTVEKSSSRFMEKPSLTISAILRPGQNRPYRTERYSNNRFEPSI